MKTHQMFSQSWSEVTGGERNAIVFEHLNQRYGAYEIRINYDRTLLKAFSATALLIVLISVAMLSPKRSDEKKFKAPTISDTTTFVQPNDHPNIDPPKTPTSPPPSVPNASLRPTVTDDSIQIELDSVRFNTNNIQSAKNGTPNDSSNFIAATNGPDKDRKLLTEDTTTYDGLFVQENPEFPGGDAALFNFIRNHISYPEIIKEIRGKGVVNVGFLIDKEGNVTNVYVRNGSKYNELNNEAMRVIKMLPSWHPGKQQGFPVKVRMNLPIRFELKE